MSKQGKLEGQQFDLELLADILPNGYVRVVREDDGFYLMASEMDNPSPDEPYNKAGERVLVVVNGIGRVAHPQFRPVTIASFKDEGMLHHQVFGEAKLLWGEPRIRAKGEVSTPDGTPIPPPSPVGPKYAAVAAQRPDVAEVLTIMGQTNGLHWVELYKVYEIIRESVKPTRLERSGLATADDLSAFTGSANRPDVAGAKARHARMPGSPPKRIMTVTEAREFIARLVRAWLDSLQ